MNSLPYFTGLLPGIGGRIKDDVSDFVVEEVPLYALSGEGTHVYMQVTKRGVPTPAALERIAHHMNVPPVAIGFAGLKDAQGVTRQWMSLEHADVERLKNFRDGQVSVELVGRHGNKLRTGHLLGNRFRIRVRGVGAGAVGRASAVLDVLRRRGVPNYFGEQRFGARGDTARLGELLVRNDLDAFIKAYLGGPLPGDPRDCKAAREAFDLGNFHRALDRWPRHYANERRALSAYKKRKHAGPAVGAIDKRIKRLYVSAFQSEMFNEVLVERLATIDRVFPGDMAMKANGAVFYVIDAAAETPRADAMEIHPTGPILGFRSHLAGPEAMPASAFRPRDTVENPPGDDAAIDETIETDETNETSEATDIVDSSGEVGEAVAAVSVAPGEVNPGQIERDVLARHRVTSDDFRHVGTLKVKGTRRPLRFAITEVDLQAGSDTRGDYVEISFFAPSGCYATVVLREIMKAE
ncbi:MAG: tRNA pseudouridine(13) synthase TruD [Phycisphaerae bacterium]|nr:tRNA pseudouridine(13) synthase TruD [Phycisphaerae bacterium]